MAIELVFDVVVIELAFDDEVGGSDTVVVEWVMVGVVLLELLTQSLAPQAPPGGQTLQAEPSVHCTIFLVQQTAPVS